MFLRMTSPSTENELMLYRVLERANLTQYYDAFISQGGDDLYQLCEAGEDEFLEIMVLVGMSKKPLHVRRLQKALHEWAANPGLFREIECQKKTGGQFNAAPRGSILAAVLQHSNSTSLSPASKMNSIAHSLPLTGNHSIDRSVAILANSGLQFYNGNRFPQENSFFVENGVDYFVEKPGSPLSENSDQDMSGMAYMNNTGEKTSTSPNASTGPHLLDAHVKKICETADDIAQGLPYYAPKPLNMKKPIDKEIDEAMNIAEDDPNRMDLLRKYSAIYGRFDSKRRGGKQMNFHEMCINEAAAQLCKHRSSLLTRREELFILSRQVVREAGFQYSKGSRPKDSSFNTSTGDEVPAKVPKLESGNSSSAPDLSHQMFLPPASVNLTGFQDRTSHEGEVSPTKKNKQNHITPTNNAEQHSKNHNKNKADQGCKSHPSSTPRKPVSFKCEPSDDQSGVQEEVDEQKEWQREVGLDSLNIAANGESCESAGGTTSSRRSSIIQALRDGIRSSKVKSTAKADASSH